MFLTKYEEVCDIPIHRVIEKLYQSEMRLPLRQGPHVQGHLTALKLIVTAPHRTNSNYIFPNAQGYALHAIYTPLKCYMLISIYILPRYARSQ